MDACWLLSNPEDMQGTINNIQLMSEEEKL